MTVGDGIVGRVAQLWLGGGRGFRDLDVVFGVGQVQRASLAAAGEQQRQAAEEVSGVAPHRARLRPSRNVSQPRTTR